MATGEVKSIPLLSLICTCASYLYAHDYRVKYRWHPVFYLIANPLGQ